MIKLCAARARPENRPARWKWVLLVLANCYPLAAQSTNVLAPDITAFKRLSLEELFQTEITSVARRTQNLSDAPSAIQVITGEDIRRSGASSLPEALRLASNLEVAQIDSRQWAISSRGFNSTSANKLLVMIDGRTVYTPLYSGVFWDVQNVMLEDIDRIEVISGPGATLWGANAVNGVINVISKNARDTQGTLFSAGGGSFLNYFGTFRHGDKIGKDVYFRLYGTGFERDTALLPNGRDGINDWALGQGGFRADWLPEHGESFTLQGDFYGGSISRPAPGDMTVNGQNLLARWTHPIHEDSDLTVQAYWDRTWRRNPNVYSEVLDTYDIDAQYRVPIGDRNKLIAGLGYRLMLDSVGNTAALAFLPPDRHLQLFSGFLQDEITLIDDALFLTLGSKLEHNDYSGFEIQPSVRLAWKPLTNHMFWTAISRAVRSPSRIDTELYFPGVPPYSVRGGGDEFSSEKLISYELGYRTELSRRLSFSIATFYNDYDDIRSVEPIPGTINQGIILNELAAQTYGAEFSLLYQPTEWWRLRGGYTYFKKRIIFGRSRDVNGGTAEGNDPHHIFVLHSMINLPANFEFDSVIRFVDDLDQRGPIVPGYLSLDLRLGWRPSNHWELSIVGQNLLDPQHAEFGAPAVRQEIPRSVYGKVTWRF